MISGISILNHKSFHPTQSTQIVLETDGRKPVLFYGQNGAGKSAIGEVIRGLANADPKFAQCRMTTSGEGRFRYLVYNHHFVQEVIGEAKGLPGIFTMGVIDGVTQKEIEHEEQLGKEVEAELERCGDGIKDLDERLGKALDLGKEEIWKAHTAHSDGDFSTYLKGYGRDKKKFFDDLKKKQVPAGEALDDLGSLRKRLADVMGDEQQKAKHSVPLDAFASIEALSLWQEKVEVSSASRLAPLIERLNNGDWVGKGRSFVQDDLCPFCQGGLPHEFSEELAKLFDGARQEKIDAITSNTDSYDSLITTLAGQLDAALREPLAADTSLVVVWEAVDANLRANLATMRLKVERPSDSFEVAMVDMTPLNEAIAALNRRVEEFNQRVSNKEKEHKAIGEMFWKILYRDRKSAYTVYEATIAQLGEQRKDLVAIQQQARTDRAAVVTKLTELKKNQEGVDAAVIAINARLRGLGIETFTIERKDGEGSLYCLARPHIGESTTQSLSEGEKTLISFFYFMELLKGSAEQGQTVDLGKTVVVVDDPISSLSHNYVYDIASILVQELMKPPGGQKVRQVIALTHNLFFLQEIVFQLAGRGWSKVPQKCQLLRVVKNDHSQVVPMTGQDFANDYDALWQTIRDIKDRRIPIQVMPNTMRCIVETFFAFTGRHEALADVLADMSNADASFKPLERYLHRGSHRDAVNIAQVDWAQFNLDYFFSKLEMLFERAGHPDHFSMKMGLIGANVDAD